MHNTNNRVIERRRDQGQDKPDPQYDDSKPKDTECDNSHSLDRMSSDLSNGSLQGNLLPHKEIEGLHRCRNQGMQEYDDQQGNIGIEELERCG